MASASLARPFDGHQVPAAGVYRLDPPHTFAHFSVQHLVIGRVRGRFNTLSGAFTIAEDPRESSLEVRIETVSVDTQNAMRDEDLRGARFLDVANFPIMTYCGAGVTPQLGGRWTVDGELTVRDVSRPVPLDGVFTGAVLDSPDKMRVAFQATAAISRKEFGLTTELDKESGGFLLGRDITIEIDVEAILE